MSKGSAPRPMDVPKERFDEAFNRIFGKKEKKEEPCSLPEKKSKN